ncbi:MAG: 3,5-cyclic-AMP phosphodiesterase, partial [Gemmatimonadaceae bacterium]|nr:3,5-cyclic-AMP phosphodiesterase [Gemmatimonadaceae bacterium]
MQSTQKTTLGLSTETTSDPEPNRDGALDSDGLDRRNFLSCMAWVGTGLLWTVSGGVP